MRRLLFFGYPLLLCVSLQSFSQKNTPKVKFGDVTAADFAPAVYSIDSSANAVVLADIGDSKYEGSNQDFFNLIFHHFKRIRLMNKSGFGQATIEIELYIDGRNEERIQDLEAVTYNLEDGKVVATKLDKASIFSDKYGQHHTLKKFTFPNIKEGSIIEYKYTIESPFPYDLQPWSFQGELPRLWSEYQVTIPNDILDFVLLKHGNQTYVLDTSYASRETYNILVQGAINEAATPVTLSSNTVTVHWAKENVPPLKDETFVTSLDNYTARIEFQLRRIKTETYNEEFLGNWNQLVERLMKRDNFGVPITDNNGWMKDDLKRITAGATTDFDKAKKIYEYIRDNFTCSQQDCWYTTQPLKKTYQDKSGTVGDINLLLVAALKNVGLDATPAILSTRENGKADELYPIIEEYNYVIAKVNIGDASYMLDATNKMAGFGKLGEKLYNGSARLIADLPALVPLSADSLHDSKVTSIFISNNDDGKGLTGSFTTKLGDIESMSFRERLAKEKQEDYFKDVKKSYSFETDLSNTEIDSLKIPEEPVTVKYDFTINPNGDDIIYFNPIMAEAYKENPFKAATRLYPVEMNACSQETIILNMEVPKGYKVEELPKSARVMLNETDGMFEYIIAENAGRVQLRCRVVLNKANFDPEDYQTLRDFFAFIVKKEAEQIVFKKL